MTKFTFTIIDGKEHKRTIEEITSEEAKGKHAIGIAHGQDLGHCLDLGARYSKETNFLEEVKYYRVINEQATKRYPFVAEFYQ